MTRSSVLVFDLNSGLWFDKPWQEFQLCMRCENCNKEFNNYMRRNNVLLIKFNEKFYNKRYGLQMNKSIQELMQDFRQIALAATKWPNDPPLENLNIISIFEEFYNLVFLY